MSTSTVSLESAIANVGGLRVPSMGFEEIAHERRLERVATATVDHPASLRDHRRSP